MYFSICNKVCSSVCVLMWFTFYFIFNILSAYLGTAPSNVRERTRVLAVLVSPGRNLSINSNLVLLICESANTASFCFVIFSKNIVKNYKCTCAFGYNWNAGRQTVFLILVCIAPKSAFQIILKHFLEINFWSQWI